MEIIVLMLVCCGFLLWVIPYSVFAIWALFIDRAGESWEKTPY